MTTMIARRHSRTATRLAIMAAVAGLLSAGADRAADRFGWSGLRGVQSGLDMVIAARSGVRYGAAGDMVEAAYDTGQAVGNDAVETSGSRAGEGRDARLHVGTSASP